MINALIDYLKNKKILILGFGLEGYSTYKFIRRHLKEQKIYISDMKSGILETYEDVKSDENVELVEQSQYLQGLEEYDIIMKTPGISFANIDTSKFYHKIKSQLELFLEFVDVFTIGVTGTKGKSTTSSLIYEILKNQLEDVHLLGNIGVPLFDEIDKLNEKSVVVLELSSHQLEFAEVSPNIAILLNIFEEHLDHYKSYEHYINAKINICRFQKEDDYFIYNIDNQILSEHIEKIDDLKQNVYEISCLGNTKKNKNSKLVVKNGKNIEIDVLGNSKKDSYKDICEDKNETFGQDSSCILYTDSDDRKLLGDHNFNNIMFAITVAKIMNLDLKKAQETIYNFEPLPHRLEFVGEFDGVKYYNDSIATIPEAAINAVETLKNVDTLIIGGKDRGVDFSELVDYLNNSEIKNLVCLPDTGWMIAKNILNKNMNVQNVNNMQEAVDISKKVTEKGKICLLSPAASSYGFFKNFKERGDLFKKCVKGEIL